MSLFAIEHSRDDLLKRILAATYKYGLYVGFNPKLKNPICVWLTEPDKLIRKRIVQEFKGVEEKKRQERVEANAWGVAWTNAEAADLLSLLRPKVPDAHWKAKAMDECLKWWAKQK